LTNVCFDLKDLNGYTAAAHRLVKLTPRDPDVQYGLIAGYLSTSKPALAHRQARRFVELFPDDARAGDASNLARDIQPMLEQAVSGMGLSAPADMDFLCVHEEVQIFMDDGGYGQARHLAESLLRTRPTFVPALNNLSLMEYAQGNLDRAIGTAQRALTVDRDNYHALSNVARYLCLRGNLNEAQQAAARLKLLSQNPKFHTVDFATKTAEALSYLGDDEGVLAVAALAEAHAKDVAVENAFLLHLTAVATMRLGDEATAKTLWKQALHIQPGLTLAQENVDDLRKPKGERNAPFPYSITYWLSEPMLVAVRAEVQTVAQRGDDDSMARAMRRLFRKHPALEKLVPMLLDRGDAGTRELGLLLAKATKTPALLEALRDFTLSNRGTDSQRMAAGQTAREAGLLGAKVRLWVAGEQQELLLMGFQIHREPSDYGHPAAVQDLAQDAVIAMRENDLDEAETLLEEALRHEPDAPDLQMNLSRIYEARGNLERADAMMRDIHRRHPDYFFGRIGMARLYIRMGQLDEARLLLNPLLEMTRIHVSEFASLAVAEGELHLARNEPEGARRWLNMLEEVDPDNPVVGYLKSRLLDEKRVGKLKKRLFGRM